MFRKIAMALLTISAIGQSNVGRAEISPPVCPQGSWAMRTGTGWTCSKNMTPPDNPAPGTNSDSPNKGRGHRGGGGMPQ